MYVLHIHKDAEKALKKAPQHIKEKSFECLQTLVTSGLMDFPYHLGTLKGEYKKFKYMEIKISGDYRIIFRQEKNQFFIRYAGTHNSLGTG